MTAAADASSPIDPGTKPGPEAITNRQLFFWMFRFLKPVTSLVVLACLWLTLTVIADVSSTKVAGAVLTAIQKLIPGRGIDSGFWRWLTGVDSAATYLRRLMLILAGLVVLQVVFRYLREVANSKMSMTMVYYIREAVYDKLQRVGFGFHDVLSTGQLINRALTDLQNVRQFIQTAVLTTLEIVLYVVLYMALIYTLNPWLALLSLVPLPIWTWYIVRFGKVVQPASKAVMESGDKNVSLITENIAGVHVIKAFATEPQEVGKYNGNADVFFERTLNGSRCSPTLPR